MPTHSTKRRSKRDDGYLVATFANFPGVRMPLLSDEECRARGIEPGRLPPVETWTDERRAALDELADVVVELVVRDILAARAAGTTAEADPNAYGLGSNRPR